MWDRSRIIVISDQIYFLLHRRPRSLCRELDFSHLGVTSIYFILNHSRTRADIQCFSSRHWFTHLLMIVLYIWSDSVCLEGTCAVCRQGEKRSSSCLCTDSDDVTLCSCAGSSGERLMRGRATGVQRNTRHPALKYSSLFRGTFCTLGPAAYRLEILLKVKFGNIYCQSSVLFCT